MTYTDEEIEKAARILCEQDRVTYEHLVKGINPERARQSASHFYSVACSDVRKRVRELQIEEALRRAKGETT